MTIFARLAAKAERTASALSLEAAVHVVARSRGIDPDEVRTGAWSRQRQRNADGRFVPGDNGPVIARQEAIYLATTVFGRPVRAIARVAGISAPAVLKACRAVEDRRDGDYDRHLDELELELLP